MDGTDADMFTEPSTDLRDSTRMYGRLQYPRFRYARRLGSSRSTGRYKYRINHSVRLQTVDTESQKFSSIAVLGDILRDMCMGAASV